MPRISKPAVFDRGAFNVALAKSIGVQNLFLFDQASGQIVDFMNPQLINGLLTSGMAAGFDTAGRVITGNGTSGVQVIALPAPMQTASAGNLVIAGRIKAAAVQSNTPGQAFGLSASTGTQTNFGIGFDNSNPPKAGSTWLTGNGAGTTALSVTAVNTWVTVAAQVTNMASSPSAYAWINGQPATSGQGGLISGGVATMDELVFCGQHRNAGYLRWLNGAIEWAAILAVPATPMPDAWHWQLYADDFPYNLFSTEISFVKATAASFNPVWARNNNTMIQAGMML